MTHPTLSDLAPGYALSLQPEEGARWRWELIDQDGETAMAGIEASHAAALATARFAAGAASAITRVRRRRG